MIGWIKWRGRPIAEEPSSAGRRWRLKPRELRLLLYLLVLSGVAAWKYVPRPWHPTCTVETAHHIVYSTATLEQTQETAGKLLLLFNAYSNCFGGLPSFNSRHPKLKLKLYQDRDEFRRINPNLGWAEAFYSWPFCQAYFSSKEANPYHWMLHESTHQLNKEVANLKLAKWMEEGLATYFSTSVLSMEANRSRDLSRLVDKVNRHRSGAFREPQEWKRYSVEGDHYKSRWAEHERAFQPLLRALVDADAFLI